ncbi:MAG: DUF3822 family protein [Bacteroidales bacterium]|nr:DUF3822 family protein [Bacteroidales bacterium]
MQSFAYIDETLDINLTQSYELSIQLSLNGLSFCLLDTVRNKFIVLKHIQFQAYSAFDDYLDIIEKAIESNDLLNHEYRKVKLVWISNKNTLIPSSLFNIDNLKTYFEFNQKLNDLDEIHYTELKYANAYSVFTIPNQIATIFTRVYSNIIFYNQQTPEIENALFRYNSNEFKVLIHVENDFFDLIITQKGKLLLYNNFVYKNEIDMLYYIMYSFEQLKINPESIDLILSGILTKNSKEHLKLKEFIRHIRFEKHSEENSFSYTFNKIAHHHYTNLFNLNICE